MKQEHQPYNTRTFTQGADQQTDPELLGAQDDGSYIDMRNGRQSGKGGKASRVEKLSGEALLYPQINPNYFCMARFQVSQYDVEIFADRQATLPSLVRVNGTIVLSSSLFPVRFADPIQYSTSEGNGGEFIFSGEQTEPMELNVEDMVNAVTADPQKYFSAFRPELYSINLFQNLDSPIYVEHVDVGPGGGLPVGNHQWVIALVTNDGDRTNLSVPTPMVPVIQSNRPQSQQYPYSKTYSSQPAPTIATRYGVKIRFRVTNLFNYDYVEVVRISWDQGAGVGFTPVPVVVGRIDIAPNEVSIRDFVDPGDSNIQPPQPLSQAQLSRQLTYILGAKSPKYTDTRTALADYTVASRQSQVTFNQISGQSVHPVIDRIGTAGMGDLWNYVYRRPYMHGERYGFSVTGFDGVFGAFFSQKIPDATNLLIPNRRTPTSATTDLYSYGGTVRAANENGSVSSTHEVFDLTTAVSKTDKCSFKNIYRRENTGVFGWKSQSRVTEDCIETSGQIENHGAKVNLTGQVYPAYHPYTPVSHADPNTDGHNYIVNTQISPSNSASDAIDYTPRGFAPCYYSQGLLLAGIDNIPPAMKAFAITRTDAAGRVVAQGIGCYAMSPAEFQPLSNTKLCTKEQDRFWFYSPDLEDGFISPDIFNDIVNNPDQYQVQLVSPLGFFSEVYSFENNSLNSDRSRLIDMVTYARIIRDEYIARINPGEDAAMGINGGDGYNYPAYGRYRNVGQQPAAFPSQGNGAAIFNLTDADIVVEGRGSYLSIRIDTQVYGRASTGGTSDRNFEDAGLKNFTEPLYIVNIIKNGAQAKDDDITDYRICHYQKIESVIGRSSGLFGQSFQLVDERWEDCIPALTSTHPTATTDRYIWVRTPAGVDERWINVTYKTPAQLTAIIFDIVNNGGAGYLGSRGVYRHVNQNDRVFTVLFNEPGFVPQQDSLILVKYDNTAPIRYWGGDSTVGEAVFAPIDRVADAYDDASDTQFAFGIGFPYRKFKLNPRHYVIADTTGTNRIQDESWLELGYIRQMCMMFTVESRAALAYAYGTVYPNQFFPGIHYVMRPNRWDTTKNAVDQNIYPAYEADYPGEINNWKWGGFRFRQLLNHEHTNQSEKRYFSAPEFGFEEQLRFPQSVIWSLPKSIRTQKSPGRRSFPANNTHTIPDYTGGIKLLDEFITSKGTNLYAFTETGVWMFLTSKSILSDLNGGEIAYMAAPEFIKGHYPISRTVGLNGELWRAYVHAQIPITVGENMAEQLVDGAFFMSRNSAHMIFDNQITDIGQALYYPAVSSFIDTISPSYGDNLCAVYNQDQKEYWIHTSPYVTGDQPDPTIKTLMYSAKRSRWIGYNDYRYDKMSMFNKVHRGTRNSVAYNLDAGTYVMNGQPVRFEMYYPESLSPRDEKEFIRIRVNSERSQKPDQIIFYDPSQAAACDMSQANFGPLYLKWYDGWEQFIPSRYPNPSGGQERLQERLIFVRIIHTLPSSFSLVMSSIQSKILK